MSSSIDNSTNRIRTDSKPTDSSSGSGSDSSRHSSSSSSRNSSSSSSSSMRAALLQLWLVAVCTAILLLIFKLFYCVHFCNVVNCIAQYLHVQYSAVRLGKVEDNTMQYSTLCSTLQYNAIQLSTLSHILVPRCTKYCIVLFHFLLPQRIDCRSSNTDDRPRSGIARG
jgi:hypothetical protein